MNTREAPTTVIRHQRSEGVLCWGGPEHGRVIALDDRPAPVVFPVAARLGHRGEPIEPVGPAFGTVIYDVKRFAALYDDGDVGEQWSVLVYGENQERLIRNLEGTTLLLFLMAQPWRYTVPVTP